MNSDTFDFTSHDSVSFCQLFSHLVEPMRGLETAESLSYDLGDVHIKVVTLGHKMANGLIVGGNARCVAMLEVLKDVIRCEREMNFVCSPKFN